MIFKNLLYSIFLLFFTIIFITPFFLAIPLYIIIYLFSSHTKLYNYTLNLCKSYDQFANSAIFGNIDQSISGRLGLAIENNSRFKKLYIIICSVLNKFFNQENHCLEAIERDRVEHNG